MHINKISKIIFPLVIPGYLFLFGCSNVSSPTPSENTANATISSDSVDAAVSTKPTDEIFEKADLDYFTPFADPEHSFCLLNEGAVLPMQAQTGNTCWANAAVTSMESSCYLKTGEVVSFDAMDLVRNTYHPKVDAPDTAEDPDKKDQPTEGLYITVGEPDFYGGGIITVLGAMSATPVGGFFLSDLYINDMEDVDSIKEMIRTYGAVNISTHHGEGFFPTYFHGYKTQNYTGQQPDHIVSLIGWDDDFPAEAFSPAAAQNGAWLVQNSLSRYWGNKGYYWLSYSSALTAFVYIPTNDYQYALNHGAYVFNALDPEDSEAVYAAVYEVNGALGAVGIVYNRDETDLSYTVEILDGEFGETLLSFSGTEDMPGYHIAKLPEPLDVETCTVVVHKHKYIPVEGESSDNAAVTRTAPGPVEFVATSEPGRSFVLINGEWVDSSSEEIKTILDLDYVPGDVFLPVLYN
ncbi:Cysteine protease, C1A family [Lachnospiraceae bacterium XPB1003]|nr:Cysteine protease, C1A family [Lachnospiraceae bacterium XPB1003]